MGSDFAVCSLAPPENNFVLISSYKRIRKFIQIIKSTFKKYKKMKFSALFTFVLAQEDSSNGTELAERGRVPSQEQGSKRYSQLVEMMGNYNAAFDERKYWTYGCNCLILGDRPMSDPGHGKPVDELDTVCKAYKDCLKCARLIDFFLLNILNVACYRPGIYEPLLEPTGSDTRITVIGSLVTFF